MESNRYRSFAALLIFFALILTPATIQSQSKPTGKDLVMGGLKCGITKTEVLKILKEPNRKEDNGIYVVWTYTKPSLEVTLDDMPDYTKKLPEPIVKYLTTRSASTSVTVDGNQIKVGGKLSDVEKLLGKAQDTELLGLDTEYLWFKRALGVITNMSGTINSITLKYVK